jgi:hypothetical protein
MSIIKNNNSKIVMPNRSLGNALRFNPATTNQYCSVAHNSLLAINLTNSVTISAWLVVAGALGNGTVVYCKGTRVGGSPTANTGYIMTIRNTNVRFSLYSSTNSTCDVLNCTFTFTIGKLYNIVITKNSTYGSISPYNLYINNILQTITYSSSGNGFSNSLNASSITDNGVTGLYIAEHIATIVDNFATDGNIYMIDLKKYNVEFTAAKIDVLYRSRGGSPIAYRSDLVLDWRFDERNGKSITDYSGNGLTGTLTNYTDVETANAGQPQSGNTAWVNSYGLAPITV